MVLGVPLPEQGEVELEMRCGKKVNDSRCGENSSSSLSFPLSFPQMGGIDRGDRWGGLYHDGGRFALNDWVR